MQARTKIERQHMECGYEPRLPDDKRKHLMIWQPPSGGERVGYKGPKLTTCAGFTTKLPEVLETAYYRAHWKEGALEQACDGKPTPHLMGSLLVLDSQFNALEAWLMTTAADGGGGK